MNSAGRHQLAEGHFDPQPNRRLLRGGVGEFAAEPAAAVVIDGHEQQRRIE